MSVGGYVVEGDIAGSLSGVHIQMRLWESGAGRGVESNKRIARLTLDLSTCPLLFVCLFVCYITCIYIPSLFNGLMVTGDGGLEGSSWRPRQAIPWQHLHYLRHHLHGPALLPLSRSPAQGRTGAAGGRGGGESRLCQSSFGRRLKRFDLANGEVAVR